MPIFIDPNVVAPAAPEVVSSPDGQLFAQRRSMGVLLKAKFADPQAKRTNLALDPVFEHPTEMSSGGGATKLPNTAWKMYGDQSVKIVPSGTDSASAAYVASAANLTAMTAGNTYKVSAWIRVDAVQTGTLHSAARRIVVGYINDSDVYNYTIATSAAAPNTAGAVVRLSVSVTMPNDTKKPLVRLMNGSANSSQTVSWSAVLIEQVENAGVPVGSFFYGGMDSDADWRYRWVGEPNASASIADPTHALKKVRFVRGDGTLVRSGNDAWAPGGVAYAFDNEAPAGSTVLYRAYPISKDGVPGEPTEALAILTDPIGKDQAVWLKSVEHPTLSMELEAQIPDPELISDSRVSMTDIPGHNERIGSWDKRIQRARTFQFKTYTHAERDELLRLLDSGPLLWQGEVGLGIADFYCLPDQVSEQYQVGAYDPRRIITVTLEPCGRPPTLGVPMSGAGRSYDWLASQVDSYDQVPSLWPTYPDIIESGGPKMLQIPAPA